MFQKLTYTRDQKQLTAVGFALSLFNCLQLDAGAGGLCSPIQRKGRRQGVCRWPWVLLDHRVMTSKPSQTADLRNRGNSETQMEAAGFFIFFSSPDPASTSAFMLDTAHSAFPSKQHQFPPLLRVHGCTSCCSSAL